MRPQFCPSFFVVYLFLITSRVVSKLQSLLRQMKRIQYRLSHKRIRYSALYSHVFESFYLNRENLPSRHFISLLESIPPCFPEFAVYPRTRQFLSPNPPCSFHESAILVLFFAILFAISFFFRFASLRRSFRQVSSQ